MRQGNFVYVLVLLVSFAILNLLPRMWEEYVRLAQQPLNQKVLSGVAYAERFSPQTDHDQELGKTATRSGFLETYSDHAKMPSMSGISDSGKTSFFANGSDSAGIRHEPTQPNIDNQRR